MPKHEFYLEIEKYVKQKYWAWGRLASSPRILTDEEYIALGEKTVKEQFKLPPEKFTLIFIYAYNLEGEIFAIKSRFARDVAVQPYLDSKDLSRNLKEKALKIASLPEEEAIEVLSVMTNFRTTIASAEEVQQRYKDRIETALKQSQGR